MKKMIPLFVCLFAAVCAAEEAPVAETAPVDAAAAEAAAPAKKSPAEKKAAKPKKAKAEAAPAAEEIAAAEAPSPVGEVQPAELAGGSFYDSWLRGRLSLGLGVASTSLTDAERSRDKGNGKTFVGFIYKLEDEDETAVVPTVSYWIPDYVRLSLTWDSVSGRTRNYNTETRHSDGVVEAAGPAFVAELTLPFFDDRVLVHAGGGVVWAMADFKEDTWWHLNYSSEKSWQEYGSPKKVNGRYREIRVDDSVGILGTAGVSWRPFEHMELDFSARYVRLEPDCEFGYRSGHHFASREEGDFTLDHLTLVASLSYVF